MHRFRPALRRVCRSAMKRGELTVSQQEAVLKLLRNDNFADAVQAECSKLAGMKRACSAANEKQSNRPILDWLRANLMDVLMIVVRLALLFL